MSNSTTDRVVSTCLKQHLLFEVGFVLVLFLKLLLCGLVGKHVASAELGGLNMSEPYTKQWKKCNYETASSAVTLSLTLK